MTVETDKTTVLLQEVSAAGRRLPVGERRDFLESGLLLARCVMLSAWPMHIAQGRGPLISSSLNRKRFMPSQGGRTQLSDEDVIAAVDSTIDRAVNQRNMQ